MRSDTALVASLVTRAALSVLAPDQFPAFPSPYFVFGRETDTSYGDPFKFNLPLSTNYFPFAPRPDCPICGATPKELHEIDITSKVWEILKECDAN
jgi:hypothetical protein